MPNNIKALRVAAGLSQSQLAKLSGVPVDSIQNWEQGYRKPVNVYLLHKVALALECQIEDLINFDFEEEI